MKFIEKLLGITFFLESNENNKSPTIKTPTNILAAYTNDAGTNNFPNKKPTNINTIDIDKYLNTASIGFSTVI